jgi:hypothetical protein
MIVTSLKMEGFVVVTIANISLIMSRGFELSSVTHEAFEERNTNDIALKN